MADIISANVFRADAFSGLTLTEQVNRVPFIPTMLGDLNLFDPLPIATTALQVSQKQGVLTLIPTSPRGAPLKQRVNEKRTARYFECPRLAEEDTIYASELQNVVSEMDGQQLKDLVEEVAIRLTGPTGLMNLMAFTWEYHRLGAIQGVLLDADGKTVINNWYLEFGITPPVEIGFDLANVGGQAAGYVQKLCNVVRRAMQVAGQGAFIENVTQVHALAGHAFFDSFTAHPDVVRTYLNFVDARNLRDATDFTTFYWGGIYWHDYRGSDDGSSISIPADKVKFFPVKAPGVFSVAMAPGEGFGDVNKRGKRVYVYRDIDPSEEQAWVRFKVKSFPLHICKRPEMLLSGRMEP